MRYAIITDSFPPLCNSAAVQIRDLAAEFVRQGYLPTVLVPDANLEVDYLVESCCGVRVVRLKAPEIRGTSYLQRTLREFCMPFAMLAKLRKSPIMLERWDGIIWYSPSIFFGPLINELKRACACKSYLILRDIFPDWAVDLGLMRKGFPYWIFKLIEKYQYSVADVIGVQTPGNCVYFPKQHEMVGQRVEVLQNWLAESPNIGCSINVDSTTLAGRRIFVYAGNMGVAQGVGILLDLAELLRSRRDLGFLFVGRGSDVPLLRNDVLKRGLDNVLIFDGIDSTEIPGLYAQCDVGLVALDPRHRSHNIPGKFLSYMQCGLPVLASINPGNDLVDLIEDERVGRVCTDSSVDSLAKLALNIVDDIEVDFELPARCKALAAKLFSPEVAVRQITKGLEL